MQHFVGKTMRHSNCLQPLQYHLVVLEPTFGFRIIPVLENAGLAVQPSRCLAVCDKLSCLEKMIGC